MRESRMGWIVLKGAAALLVASALTLSAAPVSAQTNGEFVDNLSACNTQPITADNIAPCTWVIDHADLFRGVTSPDFDIYARFMRAIAFRVSGNINAGEPDYQASIPYFLAHLNDYPTTWPSVIATEQNSRCWERAIHNTDLAAARAMCDDAIRLQPDYAGALDSRGLIGLQQQQWEAAYRDYDAAINTGGAARASWLYGRGLAALQLGNIPEGQDDLAHAREIDPDIDAKYASFGQRVDPRFAHAETAPEAPQTEVADEAAESTPAEGGHGTCAATPDETARRFDSDYSAWLAGYPQHSDRLGAQAQYQYMYFIAEEALSRIESARTCLGTHYETLRAGHTRTRDSARDGCVALSSTSTCRPTYPW